MERDILSPTDCLFSPCYVNGQYNKDQFVFTDVILSFNITKMQAKYPIYVQLFVCLSFLILWFFFTLSWPIWMLTVIIFFILGSSPTFLSKGIPVSLILVDTLSYLLPKIKGICPESFTSVTCTVLKKGLSLFKSLLELFTAWSLRT